MKAIAKHDVKILMEGNRFSNFIAGHEYRCKIRETDIILIDEDKCGFITDKESFYEDFQLVK